MSRTDVDHYRGLELWGPVALADVLGVIEGIPLRRGLRVLDVGCGQGAVLLDLAARLGARITGVDKSEAALTMARAACVSAAPDADATWLLCDANEVAFDDGTFDLVLNLGGPYRNDSQEQALRLYRRWLSASGHLVVGDGFWAQPPPAPYLEATGLPGDTLLSREELCALHAACGYESVAAWIATRAAWDRFEDTVLANHEAYARSRPDDPQVQSMITRKRAWNAAQQQWGRDTMGFAVDVLRPV